MDKTCGDCVKFNSFDKEFGTCTVYPDCKFPTIDAPCYAFKPLNDTKSQGHIVKISNNSIATITKYKEIEVSAYVEDIDSATPVICASELKISVRENASEVDIDNFMMVLKKTILHAQKKEPFEDYDNPIEV